MRSTIPPILSLGMSQALRSRLKVAASAFASNAVNGNLRRAQLSYFAAWTAEWAFTVALGIVAYRDGGATAVGLVGLLRTIRGVATAVAGIVVAVSLTVGMGAVFASLLIDLTNVPVAMVAIGALCPILVAATWRRLGRPDRDIGELDKETGLLRGIPTLLPLPLPAIEHLARSGTGPCARRPGGISPG